MNDDRRTEKQKIGAIGEDTACKFLKKHGHKVVTRNYWQKWGEIDIISEKKGILHFVEVKTVSRENLEGVNHETDDYNPEDNVHPKKLQRLARTIQTYLLEKNIEDKEWQLDVLAVFLDVKNKKAKVRVIEDVII